jgi:four helix bundle protein
MTRESYQSNSSTIKRAQKLVVDTIRLCDDLPQKRPAWVISDQLIRSISSIGANIAEAQSSGSRKEFKRFLEISLKSANESIYWLEILGHLNFCPQEKVNSLLDETTQLSKILGRSIITMKSIVSKSI